MKRLIIRRRQIRFLLGILLFLVILLATDASGIFSWRLKALFEEKLGKKFKAVVKIEEIEGGIFRRLRLKNLAVYRQQDERRVLSLKVKTASVDYRLWDFLLNFFILGKNKHYLKNIFLFSPEIYAEELLALGSARENGASGGSGQVKYPLYARKLFGGISEELTVSIHNAKIYFYGGKPIIEQLSGEVVLGKDWLKAKQIEAQIQGIPVLLTCRFYDLHDNPRFDAHLSSRFLDSFLNINGTLTSFNIFGMSDFIDRRRLYCSGEGALNGSALVLQRLTFNDFYNVSGTFEGKKRIAHFEMEYKGETVAVLDSSFPSLSRQKTFIRFDKLMLWQSVFSADITIETTFRFVKNFSNGPLLEGLITASGISINNSSCYDLSVEYGLINDNFILKKLSLGRGVYTLKGRIKLKEPYYSDLNFEIRGGKLVDFWILGKDESGRKVKGNVNGKIKIWGNLFSPTARGHIQSKGGDLGNFNYESAYALLESEGPVIRIVDGFLRKKDGNCVLGGQIDLRRIGTSDIIRQIKISPALSADKRFSKGTEEEKETSQMVVGRDISSRVHVDYKVEHIDETKYQDKQDAEVEVKYKVKKDQTLRMRLKSSDEFFGLEHKIKF